MFSFVILKFKVATYKEIDPNYTQNTGSLQYTVDLMKLFGHCNDYYTKNMVIISIVTYVSIFAPMHQFFFFFVFNLLKCPCKYNSYNIHKQSVHTDFWYTFFLCIEILIN